MKSVITIPEPMDKSVKKEAIEQYDRLVDAFDEKQIAKTIRAIPRVVARLTLYPNHWPAPVGFLVRAIFDEAFLREEGSRRLHHSSKPLILSALGYVCEPNDVIPDYTPGTGYYDDAFVLNECLRRLSHSDPMAYKRILSAYARQNNESY